MSAKRITMRQLKKVLRLSFSVGLSIRKISASTKVSVGSIQQILKRAEQLQLSWPLPDDLDDQALALKFYPQPDAKPSRKRQEPDWLELHQELKKKGVTKQLLWEEYAQQFPNRCYSIRSSAPVLRHGLANNSVPCGKAISPAKSYFKIMRIRPYRLCVRAAAKFGRRKSLWRP